VTLKLRRPDKIEMIAQAVLFFFLVLSVGGFIKALNGKSCGAKIGVDCYPWGPGGPMDLMWEYRTQGHFLTAAAVGILGLILGMLPPFFREGWKLNLVLMLWITALVRVYGPELLAKVVP